jgi:sulfur carrier protein
MQIHLNGEPRRVSGLSSPCSLLSLIAHLGLGEKRLAAEHNGHIIPRSQWADAMIQESDTLEIVHAIGGG